VKRSHYQKVFQFDRAFSRTIGWVGQEELKELQNKRVAIAGMGGVGGGHLTTLARLGIGKFHIADFDTFELENFNRQRGATMSSLGRSKVEVLKEMALDINPTLNLRQFSNGVTEENLYEFLDGVDLYVDGLDFFVLDIRRKLFAACHKLGIPAITAAPLGMGFSLLCFLPGKMSFDEYFQMEGRSPLDQYVRFLVGLSPSMLQTRYLVDQSTIRLDEKKGPSTPMACDFCSGIIGTHALKILLGRGKVDAVPYSLQFDGHLNKMKRIYRPWGNRNPLQWPLLYLAKKKWAKSMKRSALIPHLEMKKPSEIISDSPVITDSEKSYLVQMGNTIPTGDNCQPFQFFLEGEWPSRHLH